MGHDLCIDETSQVRYYILSYLAEYPESGDTVEGIQWWLLDRWIKHVSPNVKAALNELLDEGLILEHKGLDSKIHYRINQAKYKEIQKLFNQKNE